LQLAVEEEIKGKLLTQSSTSSSSTDVEHHHHRMASSSTPNLSQFVPLPLVDYKFCRIRFVWFKRKENNIIYKCPNNHAV
jgi:hypothetical protein